MQELDFREAGRRVLSSLKQGFPAWLAALELAMNLLLVVKIHLSLPPLACVLPVLACLQLWQGNLDAVPLSHRLFLPLPLNGGDFSPASQHKGLLVFRGLCREWGQSSAAENVLCMQELPGLHSCVSACKDGLKCIRIGETYLGGE